MQCALRAATPGQRADFFFDLSTMQIGRRNYDAALRSAIEAHAHAKQPSLAVLNRICQFTIPVRGARHAAARTDAHGRCTSRCYCSRGCLISMASASFANRRWRWRRATQPQSLMCACGWCVHSSDTRQGISWHISNSRRTDALALMAAAAKQFPDDAAVLFSIAMSHALCDCGLNNDCFQRHAGLAISTRCSRCSTGPLR